jgi:hypothetical protein
MDRLLKDHDLVIVAGPPTLGSAEALVYARATDASVVVVRRDQTKRDALAHAVESLTLVGADVLGVVLDARSGGRFQREALSPAAPPDFRPAAVAGAPDPGPIDPPRREPMATRTPALARGDDTAGAQPQPRRRRTSRRRD